MHPAVLYAERTVWDARTLDMSLCQCLIVLYYHHDSTSGRELVMIIERGTERRVVHCSIYMTLGMGM